MAERFLDDEMWVEIWCGTLQSATVWDVAGSRGAHEVSCGNDAGRRQ